MYTRQGATRRRLASISVNYHTADGELRSKTIRYWGKDPALTSEIGYTYAVPHETHQRSTFVK
jgi:hypothetical protein